MADTEPVQLCLHHAAVTRAAAEKDHVTDRDSERLAEAIAHQCPACRGGNQ